MQEATKKTKKPSGRLTRFELGLIAAISIPFWAAAARFGWEAVHLPAKSGKIAWIRMWEASVFSLGLAVGLLGAAMALRAARRRYRLMGLSLVILAAGCIAFAFVMASYFEDWAIGAQTQELPFVIPALLLLFSLATLLDALKTAEKPADQPPEPTSEPQLPLSRP